MTSKRHLGFIPIPALILIVAVLHFVVKPSLFFEPSWLLPITNTLFVTVVCFVIAYIAIRNYRTSGRIQILLLGCGVFAFGLSAVVAAFLRSVPVSGANLNVTIYNTGALIGAIFHFIAALILLADISQEAGSKRKESWAVLSYVGLMGLMALFTMASLRGIVPPFFIQGVGPTALRQEVLGAADILFAFSFLVFMGAYLRNREAFLYWYASALALTSISLTGFFIQSAVGSPIGWASRFSQYLGGIYFLIAVLSAVRDARARRISFDRVLTGSLSPAEEKLRPISEDSPDIICRFDGQRRHLYVNPAGIEAYGKPAASIIGRTMEEIGLPGEYSSLWKERIQKVLETGVPIKAEGYLPAGNGAAFYQSYCVPEYGVDGTVSNVLVVSRDLTERKRVEEALRESEERYRSLFNGMTEGFSLHEIICDEKGEPADYIFLEVNPGFERLTGLKREDVVGRSVLEVLPGTESYWIKAYGNVALTGQSTQFENYSAALGRYYEVFAYCPQPGQFAVLFIDVTTRRQAEESLKKNLERLDIISSTASQLLMSKEPRKLVETLCKRVMEHLDCHAFFNFLVFEEGKRLKLNAYAGIPDETAREIGFLEYGVAVCGCAAQSGCRIVAENIPTTPDVRTDLVASFGIKAYACHPLLAGDRVIGTLSFGTRSRLTFKDDELSLMRTVADQVATAMERVRLLLAAEERADELEVRVQERTAEVNQAYEALQREVEEHRRTEEQLRQAQKMEAIGTLAGGIAHDFNNILAAILGFTEMAVDDVSDRPLVERNLHNVLKSAMRARDLVKQILAFSRKTTYERTPLSLTPLMKETVQLLRASIPATIKITLTLAASSDTILASPVEVQQILMNLATNASLAMQEKGGTLEVSLTDIDAPAMEPGWLPGEYLQLAVRDTGVGMSPHITKRIFEPFFTTREVGKGTGMGLAVVYGIVKDLRGAITVESEPGRGSTFRILLPKAQTERKEDQPPAVHIRGGMERILFVDDEEMLVEWGRMTLERLGYTVTAVTDSKEALRTFSCDPSRFDLVITDQTMSGLTGVQFAQELLSVRPDIPIILCTGHSETVSPDTAKDAGIRQFLMKPLARQELADAVRRAVDVPEEQ